jgi:fatty acid desaturase
MIETTKARFPFRPWVKKAGLSIVLVAAFATAAIFLTLAIVPSARFGWMGERVVWVYLAVLWLGGLRVFLATFRMVAEADGEQVVVRPLHQFGRRAIPWARVRGTEQSGDRLIIYYDTPRGMRFVALNLNLVKGRREFLALIEQRLTAMGFAERVVERSRYLSRPA